MTERGPSRRKVTPAAEVQPKVASEGVVESQEPLQADLADKLRKRGGVAVTGSVRLGQIPVPEGHHLVVRDDPKKPGEKILSTQKTRVTKPRTPKGVEVDAGAETETVVASTEDALPAQVSETPKEKEVDPAQSPKKAPQGKPYSLAAFQENEAKIAEAENIARLKPFGAQPGGALLDPADIMSAKFSVLGGQQERDRLMELAHAEAEAENAARSAAGSGGGKAPEPGVGEGQKLPRKKTRIALINEQDAFNQTARDMAEERLTADKESLTGVSGFLKKIWKHNLALGGYRQMEILRAKQEIKIKGIALTGEDADAEQKAKQAIIERFTSEYGQETIHTGAGESSKKLERSGAEGAAYNRVASLIKDYASGVLDGENFNTERKRLLSELRQRSAGVDAADTEHFDNLLEVAQQARQKFEHDKDLAYLDDEFEIIVGRAKSGVRTEAQFNTVDRLIEKARGTKVGRMINETVLSVGIAGAYALAVDASRRVATSKLAAWATFGATAVLGGGLAAARESFRLKEERRQHNRGMAKGNTFDPGKSPERKNMEAYRYATRNAGELAGALALPENATPEACQKLLGALADAEARIQMSDLQKIDLLSYSAPGVVESERTALDIARAKAKVFLRGHLSPQEFAALGTAVGAQKKNPTENDKGIAEKDRMFDKMRRGKAAGAAFKGLIIGGSVGLLAQELTSFMSHGEQRGLFTGSDHAGQKLTTFERVREFFAPKHEMVARPAGPSMSDSITDAPTRLVTLEGGSFRLPGDTSITSYGDGAPGHYSIMRHGYPIVSIHIVDGRIVEDVPGSLAKGGIAMHELDTVQVPGPSQRVQMSSQEYAEKNLAHIHRLGWYDNDTPHVFDKNELRETWGGVGGSGVDADGNYVMSMSSMRPGGSFHQGLSLNAQKAAAEGKLSLLLSLSRDSQAYAVEVPIDAHGNAVIDPKSAIGEMFFTTDTKGHAVFVGKFAEVAERVGGADSHEYRILATDVGAGRGSVFVDTPTGMTEQHTTVLQGHGPATPPNMVQQELSNEGVLPPPIIHAVPHSPLEPLASRTKKEETAKKPGSTEGVSNEAVGNKNIITKTLDKVVAQAPETQTEAANENVLGGPIGQPSEEALEAVPYVPQGEAYTRSALEDKVKQYSPGYAAKVEQLATRAGALDPRCLTSVSIQMEQYTKNPDTYHNLVRGLTRDAYADVVIYLKNDPTSEDWSMLHELQRGSKNAAVRFVNLGANEGDARLSSDVALYRASLRGDAQPDNLVVMA